jgi:hypothetical protein
VDIQRLSFEGDEPASATPYLPHLARMRIGGFCSRNAEVGSVTQHFLNLRSDQQNFNISKSSYSNSKRKTSMNMSSKFWK